MLARSVSFLTVMAMLGVIVQATPSAAQQEIKLPGRRIVGGEKTDIKQHPWQVALDIKIGDRNHFCGGSIIADRWVLTAAHCFKPSTKPNDVRAKADATDIMDQGVWTNADRIVIHEGYDTSTQEHDIALVRLRTAPQGRVIPLVTSSMPLPLGQPLEVTGWGTTSEGGSTSTHLLKATVPFADNAVCNAPTAYNGAVKPAMMCAGHSDGGVDACQGDSGGPLVWRAANGPVLVGVVSWGEGCARKLKYGVYTRVTSYRNWIGRVVTREQN